MDVELDLRFRLGLGEASEADDRFFELLDAVGRLGSLRRASEETGMSYRSAWGLLRDWTERLGHPPVELHRGRGAGLSEIGRKLVWANRHARERAGPVLKEIAAELREALESVPTDAPPGNLTVYASHSLMQDVLRDLVSEDGGLTLDFHNHGSLESLRSLAEGDCQVAGFHLVEGTLRRQLAPQYRRYLDPARHRLVRVASRWQGLILAPAFLAPVRGVGDLVLSGLRFVNRQAGSGTRALLDALLLNEGVGPGQIDGYVHEEFTHSAVAALLSSGAADVGFGVEAAAARFNLGFVPLASETYYFAVNSGPSPGDPAIQRLVSILANKTFRDRLAGLRGYDPRHSGRWESVSDLFETEAA